MKAKVISFSKNAASDIDLNESVFGVEMRKDILHRAVEWQRARKQSGMHKVKERGEITGTTKKPFAQKGTGHARQGSLKGPHQTGGGVAHGPRVRSHAYKMPKKVRALALKVALSAKLKEGKLFVIDSAKLKNKKTKELKDNLKKLKLSSTLFIDSVVDENFKKAAGNLTGVCILPDMGANVYDILRYESLVLSVDAVKKLEERLA